MMDWNGGMMSGFGIGMGFFWLVQLALFIAVIYFAVILIKKVNHKSDTDQPGESVLKERFARGEITEEEYKKMKKILHS
ncbi:hypothetical protein EWH99_04355 [Sporolactobacillus sp. THM7-7]|nr:hypothetical protein EWH99_04355 [Sporolactobacillus sp. THM7-7]